ncbi:MAG: hypothetical protein J7L34_05635 [Thermotogaceae bacterium]|nr:hypothetical protein [Thermotogaceae bacterium]
MRDAGSFYSYSLTKPKLNSSKANPIKRLKSLEIRRCIMMVSAVVEKSGLSYLNASFSYEKSDGKEKLTVKVEKLYVEREKISYGFVPEKSLKPVVDWQEVENPKDENDQLKKKLKEFILALLSGDPEKIAKKAKELLEAYLSPEKVAKKILNFAKAISGYDKSKIPLLKEAVNEGFDEVKKIFGELPDVSKKTYDLVMKGFNEWEKESPKIQMYSEQTHINYFKEAVSIELVA